MKTAVMTYDKRSLYYSIKEGWCMKRYYSAYHSMGWIAR